MTTILTESAPGRTFGVGDTQWVRRESTVAERAAVQGRLSRAKRAFVTRRVDLSLVSDLSRKLTPRAGDLVLASVTEIGHHARVELPDGRRAQLYAGDEIVVAYGARYAPDQFEALVPERVGPCHLVAGGGIAGDMRVRHAKTRKPTEITPVGILVGDDGEPINLGRFSLPAPAGRQGGGQTVVVVVGTSMNAGKTTLAASLIRGLSASGVRVGACKVTGTGSGGDIWSMIDAGAVRALDFTDAGFATTYGADIGAVGQGAELLVRSLEESDADIIVVEIADGLLQQETAALLDAARPFAQRIDTLFLAAADSMGAAAGVSWLRERNLPLRAVSGLLTASPLAIREAAGATSCEIFPTKNFERPEFAAKVCLRGPTLRRPVSVVS